MKRFIHTTQYATAALALLLSVNVMAQTAPASGQARATSKAQKAPQGQKMGGVQALFTQEQRAELQTVRAEQKKQTNQIKFLLAEKEARLNTLKSAEKIDLKAINGVIDEVSALQAKKMKAQAALDVKIKGMLTPEQRIAYAARGQQNRMAQSRAQAMRGQKNRMAQGRAQGMRFQRMIRGQQNRMVQGRAQGMRFQRMIRGQQNRMVQGRAQGMRGQQGRMGQGRAFRG